MVVEKFDGKGSFKLWRVKMKALLVQQGIAAALDGIENLSKEMSTSDKEDMDAMAHSFIVLSLSDEVLERVLHEKTAAGLWAKLGKLYLNRSFLNRMLLKQQLISFRMRGGDRLEEQFKEFTSIINALKDIDVDVDDEDQAMRLLCSLPPKYDTFVDELVRGRDTITLEEVMSSLRKCVINLSSNSYDDDDEEEEEEEEEEYLPLRGRQNCRQDDNRVQQNSSRARSESRLRVNVECYYCHRFGHMKRHCPLLK